MISFLLLALAAAALAVISCIPDAASAYTSLPMLMLWGATALAASYTAIKRRLYRRAPLFALHASFAVILAGAAVTHFCGSNTTLHLRCGEEAHVGNAKVELMSFDIEYYPGTQAPADFRSTLRVDGRTETVSMNKVLDTDGYRLTQQSYDADHKGTVLAVAHDPAGIAVTYTGYALLFLSMIWVAVGRRLRWMAAVLIVGAAAGAQAAPATIPRPLADSLGTINIYTGGRIVPMKVYARDFALRLTGGTSYQGLSPEQILAGWLFYYDSWKNEPCLKIRRKNSRQVMGLEGKMASMADFFDERGNYLCSDAGHAEANETFGLAASAANGQLWKIFPVTDRRHHTAWYSPVDSPAGDIPVEQWHFVRHGINYLAELVHTGNYVEAATFLGKVRRYQLTQAADAIPSAEKAWAEYTFIALSDSMVPAILLIAGGLVLLIFSADRAAWWLSMGALLWVTFLISLNWWAAGTLPMGNGYETMQWMALAATLGGIWSRGRGNGTAAICCMAAGLALMVAFMSRHTPQVTTLMPVLRSPLLSLHVLTVMCAYAALAVMALCGVAALAGRSKLIVTARRLLMPAVFLLTAGIFIGAVWANNSWGRYWGWDPKEVWALITMIVYSFALHPGMMPRFRSDRFFAWFCIAAFLTVIMTYFGANYLLPGLHSYA